MSWIDTVATKVDKDRADVKEVLDTYGIRGPRSVPPRRRLRVQALHFAGVKNLQSPEASDTRNFVPFTWTRRFDTPVTALVSNGRNDAGKSSTLDILAWGLRGTSGVRSDVKDWLRQVYLHLTIGDEQVVIAWRVDNGKPTGTVLVLSADQPVDLDALDAAASTTMREHADAATEDQAPAFDLTVPLDDLSQKLQEAGAYVAGEFADEAEMKSVIGDFMLGRLGLETLTQWRRNSHATDEEDGNTAEHGWPLWSQALVIAKPSYGTTIGETANQATAVLNTFLATDWSASRNLARVQKKSVDANLAGIRRRQERDAKAREHSVADLTLQRSQVQAELDAQPPAQTSAEDAARMAQRASAATVNLTAAQRRVADAALEYGSAERALHAAESDLVALKEAAVTKRFWHSLKPSCCPRCDAQVEQAQWEREQEGSCSLCNSPIGDAQNDEPGSSQGIDDEALDPLELAEQRRTWCESDVVTTSQVHEDAKRGVELAEAEFTEASVALAGIHGNPEVRQSLERQLAVLDGRIEERSAAPDELEEEATLASDSEVLGAAVKVAEKEAKQDFDAALEAVSRQITTLGRELGMTNLEQADLKGNAHLPVIRGGSPSTFGGLTDGERLRLKIALVVSLLDVGAASGLGRHPGFLIVDSIAREELNTANGQSLLSELARVASAYDLQVITGTAHSDLVDAVLPPEAVVRPLDSRLMW